MTAFLTAGLGALAVGVSVRSFARNRPRLPLAALVGGSTAAAWIHEPWLHNLLGDPQGKLAFGLAFILLPPIVTWYLLGRTRYWAGEVPRRAEESP